MILTLANIAYFIVVILHLYFFLLETVMWKTGAQKAFGVTPEYAETTKGLASNQGLYNLFLAAALLYGFFASNWDVGIAFMIYGLGCVIVAGIWGGITVNRKIFLVQAVPAIVALGLRGLLFFQ